MQGGRAIHVGNCDVVIARGGSRADGRSAFSIISGGPARISDVRFEEEGDTLLSRGKTGWMKSCGFLLTQALHIASDTLRHVGWDPRRHAEQSDRERLHLVKRESLVPQNKCALFLSPVRLCELGVSCYTDGDVRPE